MKFSYQFFEGKFLPIINIKLKGKKEWVEFSGFIDTGASYCLFHADVAEVLGITLENGQKEEMVLGDGDILPVYIHTLSVSLAGKEFNARIGFSKQLNINMYIIGRKDIFEHFIIAFNERDKWIEFQPHV